MKFSSLAVFIAGLFSAQALQAQGPIKVSVELRGGSYTLVRGGQPYYVKGAGGSAFPGRIRAYGGNSIRTWGTRGAKAVLDSAQQYGLTVLLGLDVARERHGFNYNDTAAVRRQLERLRAEVLQYKDHPALLAWGIGNELNLEYSNPKVWDAVNDISKMIHALDPDHPSTTVLAGISKPVADYVKERCTDLDLLSVNAYGELAALPETIARVGWTGPYLVTEWGPTGHWECLQTAWKQPIEETSAEKAAVYKSRYLYGIARDTAHCLGSYVFLWGQKQERTPTWYGLFTEKGEETEVVDAMQYLWSGRWPANRAPHLYSLQLDGRRADQSIYLEPGARVPAVAVAADPDGDKLHYRWELLPEVEKVSAGGDHEDRPKAAASPIRVLRAGEVLMTAPATPGAYRVFVYVSDGKNKVATANIPFYVR
ncbi:MAG: hypothetical protein EOO11_05665 [Chitinophagaceae bacterium]|nr:MAG: hypothetical protein EOO11_05665 [Chitinophagaceae bacterium]